MAAAGHGMKMLDFMRLSKAIGEELCPQLGLTIPVGKDSMSMKTTWQEEGYQKSVTAPLSVIISAFARVEDKK